MAKQSFLMKCILSVICIHRTYSSLSSAVACVSGHCIFDCVTNQCKEILCTNTADSCTIHCGASNCDQSIFYLAATVNTIDCSGSDSCKSAQFYCGQPDIIPFGFTLNNFNHHIDSCVFTLTDNAMSDDGLISCKNDIGSCRLQTLSDDDNFKESTFECQSSQCILQCFNEKSCGSQTSHFICNSPDCECIDNNGIVCGDYIHQKLTNTQTTFIPTSSTTSKPTHTNTLIMDTILSIASSTTSYISTTFMYTTAAPSVISKPNRPIFAFAPTQPPVVSSHIYSTWIRKEIQPFIESTLITKMNNNDNDLHFGMIASVFSTLTWTIIGIGFCCIMLICCICLAMICCKRYKRRKKLKQNIVAQYKERRLSNIRNDCICNKAQVHKTSAIDLAVVRFESNVLHISGEDIKVNMDGLYDVNLDDDEDETSDDETIPGDGNPYDTISNVVAAFCNASSVQNVPGSIHKQLVANPPQMKFVPAWNSDESDDDEIEDMYNEHDGCETTYGYTTTMDAPYLSQSSVDISLPQSLDLN